MAPGNPDNDDATARITRHGVIADLAGMGITAVPERLAGLTNLMRLDLSRNRLTDLPGWLGDLQSLTYLKLGGNELTSVPGSLARLERLRSLDLSRNNLTALPGWLRQAGSLTSVFRG